MKRVQILTVLYTTDNSTVVLGAFETVRRAKSFANTHKPTGTDTLAWCSTRCAYGSDAISAHSHGRFPWTYTIASYEVQGAKKVAPKKKNPFARKRITGKK